MLAAEYQSNFWFYKVMNYDARQYNRFDDHKCSQAMQEDKNQ